MSSKPSRDTDDNHDSEPTREPVPGDVDFEIICWGGIQLPKLGVSDGQS
jgi:hypothetical protein